MKKTLLILFIGSLFINCTQQINKTVQISSPCLTSMEIDSSMNLLLKGSRLKLPNLNWDLYYVISTGGGNDELFHDGFLIYGSNIEFINDSLWKINANSIDSLSFPVNKKLEHFAANVPTIKKLKFLLKEISQRKLQQVFYTDIFDKNMSFNHHGEDYRNNRIGYYLLNNYTNVSCGHPQNTDLMYVYQK